MYDAMFRMVSLTAGRKIEPSMLPEPGKWEEGNERFDGFLRGSSCVAEEHNRPPQSQHSMVMASRRGFRCQVSLDPWGRVGLGPYAQAAKGVLTKLKLC